MLYGRNDHIYYRQGLIHEGTRYLLAYGVLALEPVLIVPLLLALLSPAGIGVLGAVEAANVVLGGISQLGVKFAYLQFVADRGPDKRGGGFWTATLLIAVTGFASGGIAAPVLNEAVRRLGMSADIHWLTLGGLLLAINLQMMLVTDLRAMRSPMPFVFANIAKLITVVTILTLLGNAFASRINTVLCAQASALGVSIVILYVAGGVPRVGAFDAGLARRFVGYGWPIAVGSLIKYGTDALLPWLCLALVSPVAAGAMALALKSAALFDTGFGLPFLMAWGGRVYQLVRERTVAAISGRLFGEIAVAMAGATLVSWCLGIWILRAAGKGEELVAQAMVLLPFALVGKALFVLRSPASIGLVATRDMKWNMSYAIKALLAFGLAGPPLLLFWGAPGGWGVFLLIEAGVVCHMYYRSGNILRREQGSGDAHFVRTSPGVLAWRGEKWR